MKTFRKTLVALATLALVGLVSAASAGAENWGRTPTRGPDPYRHTTQFEDGYTYMDYWGGNIADMGRGWIMINYRGQSISIEITRSQGRLYVGDRVRVVPFRQSGREAVAYLRLADYGFEPVGVGRYTSSLVSERYNKYGTYVPAHSEGNRGNAGFEIGRNGNAFRTPHFYNEGYTDGRRVDKQKPKHKTSQSRQQNQGRNHR